MSIGNEIQAPLNLGGATLDDWEHFYQLLGLGRDLIPAVVDPDAKRTSKSRLTRDKIGKVPFTVNKQGLVRGLDKWTTREITNSNIKEWSSDRRYNMGVRASAVRAIDVDVTDADLARDIENFIAINVGKLSKRIRNEWLESRGSDNQPSSTPIPSRSRS